MIDSLKVCFSKSLNPYENLAFEQCLLRGVRENELILYLWSNARTVVIGRNQDSYEECDLLALYSDGGFLARRFSGGGAVYHDEGNVNFTFITNNENFDVGRQTKIVLDAVRQCGIAAAPTGRNDLTVDGQKFSGHAIYRTQTASCHHGTLMINTSVKDMQRYLRVSPEKLKSNAVKSVRSRVINLCEVNPDITDDMVRDSLITCTEREYNIKAEYFFSRRLDKDKLTLLHIDFDEMESLKLKLASKEWIHGDFFHCSIRLQERFNWGNADIRMLIKKNLVERIKVFSDTLDETMMEQIENALLGAKCEKEELERCVGLIPVQNQQQEKIKEDILKLLCQNYTT